ncbi:MAG: response regulator [Acidobacteria bacterium]|nr:response regulator [Acidobacteriota bacterium]MCA1642244.1 response regulator [Acidobacteriota bacterium]
MAKLLIVDDDEVIRTSLFDLLSEEHECHTAASAEEALKHLGSWTYDAIITDLSMPGMSGEDLLGFVKVYAPRTPVIFISGKADPAGPERLLVKGGVDYLVKPFRLEEVEEAVARALGRRP